MSTEPGLVSIELIDDNSDDDSQNKERRVPTACLNVECKFGHEYIDNVPSFVLIYYKVRKQKGLKVCCQCFDEACDYFSNLKDKFLTGESIYEVPSSRYMPVHNIDSDEEDLSSDDGEEELNEEAKEMVKEKLPSILGDIVTSQNFHFQVNDTYFRLKELIAKRIAEQEEEMAELELAQKEIDIIRESMYGPLRPIIEQVSELEIIDVWDPASEGSILKSQLQRKRPCAPSSSVQDDLSDAEGDGPDVVAVSEEILTPPVNLPPPGSAVIRPKLKPGDLIYVMKYSCKYAWKQSCVVSINREKGYSEYHVKTDIKNPKKSIASFTRLGKCVAYATICSFRFTVGLRIIAVFKDETYTGRGELQYHSGIIAEPPKAVNKFRYLVFFDDGCVQYVPHEQIRLICEPSTNPWDDVPLESREFVKKYLMKYPERPMVKLLVGDVVEVKFQSSWQQGKVMEVDGSLAKMFYSRMERQEWIYRGSTRLKPLYREIQAANYRMQTGHRGRIVAGSVTANSPYVEYTRNVDVEDIDDKNIPVRSVARKSTSGANKMQITEKPVKWIPKPVPGKTIELTLANSIQPKKFVAHQCGPLCVQWTGYTYVEAKKKGGPLAIPLFYGFRRIISWFSGVKRVVIYKAPCGRSLRSMDEIHMYLRITKSSMTVDFFDFDFWVKVLNEFQINRYNFIIEDVSNAKEIVPIQCVNYIDQELPNCLSYLRDREPRENVNLNLDPNFLCGCDCTDDCQDRTKCACWKMTYEGQKLIPENVIDPEVGYHYRRLPERVITGIYECNQNCKCSKTSCLNRVVQYPLSQKLQLFKTEKKGWGVRCLTDIPQGSFISVYAGHLLTDTEANEEGKTYGDEYLAELDYIEVIERIKQDYESDVPEDLEEDLKEIRGQSKDKDDLDSPSSSSSDELTSETTVQNRGDIRYKLRERKVKPPPVPLPQAENTKKKKEKKQFTSIRKYYGNDEDDVYIMDAKGTGNIGRYLNHSCMPNVFVQNVFVDTHDLRFPWVAFFAQTYIIAGTELTWDYNYDIGSVEGTVKLCYCGSTKCRGRLL